MNAAESLRTPESVMHPDPRTSMFVGQSPLSMEAHHDNISAIQLSTAVPESVAIHFETARNLYLYAWHVYRFYVVAQTHALSTLEMGLRGRLPGRLPERYQKEWHKEPMLAGLLAYAIDHGLIRNQGFRRWHEAAASSARERRLAEAVRTLEELNLDRIELDGNEPLEITAEDQRWDLVGLIRDSIPKTRNRLAHGSPMLTNQVLGTIELVAEMLNQLYPHQSDQAESVP